MKKTIFACLLAGALFVPARAQTPTAFTGTYTWGSNGNTNSFSYNGTDIANLTESAFTKVGITTAANTGNFRASGFALDPVSGSLTGTNDPSKYFEFSLTADSGFTLSMSNINFGVGRSTTGPRTFAWSSSIDSFATIITNYTVPTGVTNNAGVLTIGDAASTTLTNIVLDLSGASFQSLTSITLRFYAYNSEASGGTGGLQAPLSFSGSLLNTNPVSGGNYWSADPAGGGSGTWISGGTTWATNSGGAGSGQTQGSGPLIFANTAGTVTVSGGVTVSNGMTFQTAGYVVQSGTVTLAGASAANNAITTDSNVTTTISSELAGTTGLTKSGMGTLILSGVNTFSGNAVIAAGALQIASDSALGNAANDLTNNGTLMTAASVALDAGRDIAGSGTFDIAGGTTLTVNGNISNTATTLNDTGTFDLQGPTRSLGALTLTAPGTINAAGAINVTTLTTSGLTNGTATINPDIVFTAGTKTLSVSSGGNLELNGAISGSGAVVLSKTGLGTLTINGANSATNRIGLAGASMTSGGTVVLASAASAGSGQIQLNSGTLRGASGLVLTNGLLIAGQTNGAAVLAGNNLEFQGQSTFFKGTGTTGPVVLNVNNTTTFSGGFGLTGGAGSGTGVTIGGNGHMIISGVSTNFSDTISLTDTVKLTLNNATIGGGLIVGGSNILAGNGTVAGNLSFQNGGKFEFNLASPTLTVNGPSVSFVNFTIANIAGLDRTTPNGTYTLFATPFGNVQTNGLANIGAANAFDLGDGKSAYFTIGSLELNVVPEPSTYALLALSGIGFAGYVVRRRRR
ncbi:MAG: PEP-CTERM sorting domain-containing protein [Chthoniobacterales bacterium]|nr:PEP-CTERM sorting domain-containing protein [Chthoniobacterales bacterium]